MEKATQSAQVVRFANFEVDLEAGELRKAGAKLKFSGQPFQVLAMLLERPGAVVTREELQKRLWPDTFVDIEHNLNSAINRIREALSDSSENPRFVETLPRRGYRFIALVESSLGPEKLEDPPEVRQERAARPNRTPAFLLLVSGIVVVLLAGISLLIYKVPKTSEPHVAHLTRLTFDDGLQIGATWSPDGRFLAYASNHGGKFDIWVQPVSGGDPVQITKGPSNNWQPDWSPDGKYIAYRSEQGEGGIYIIPALGGAGLQKKITSFGYHPRWSPDSSQILFNTHFIFEPDLPSRFYVVNVDRDPPREVLADFHSSDVPEIERPAVSATWYPGGNRITIETLFHGNDPIHATRPDFWTVPISGGSATRLQIAADVSEQLNRVSTTFSPAREGAESQFSWAPSGNAIYFEHVYGDARNIWRMTIDPKTFKAVAIDRLTTGPGLDTELSVSPDGKRLAYTGESRLLRPWLFPFDATHGKITGAGQPLTSAGINAWRHNLSHDGTKLAFVRERGGKKQLCEKSLIDGNENPIVTDDYLDFPQWSPDGKRLAYLRLSLSTQESQIMIWPGQNENPETVATFKNFTAIWDWSADGKSLLVSQGNGSIVEIWQLPVAGPHAEAPAKKLASDPSYQLWQSHFSPDSRWVVFNAVKNSTNLESSIFVIPATGGPWIRITGGPQWDDKPRWSSDGKILYFISNRTGAVFNIWGVRFDPVKGKVIGEPFRMTSFGYPGPMLGGPGIFELSLAHDKLVLTMGEQTGNIWVLDNVDR